MIAFLVVFLIFFIASFVIRSRRESKKLENEKKAWRADLEAKRKMRRESDLVVEKKKTSAEKTPQKASKSRMEMALEELKYVPKENMDHAVVSTSIKYGIATVVLLDMLKKRKKNNQKQMSDDDRYFFHDYYAGDADSYEYMQSKGINPHKKNLHLSEEQRMDMMDEMYYGDEDYEDEVYDGDEDYEDGSVDFDYERLNDGLHGKSQEDKRSFWEDHYRYDHDEYCDHEDHEHDW